MHIIKGAIKKEFMPIWELILCKGMFEYFISEIACSRLDLVVDLI